MKFYRNNTGILDIRPEDDSTQHVVHMGENVLNLTLRPGTACGRSRDYYSNYIYVEL
jgi:hypothetical protein